jgi:putative DNA primase/helicase
MSTIQIANTTIKTPVIGSISQALQLAPTAPAKKNMMDAPEIRYAEECAGNKNIATADKQLYCWTGSHWHLQSDTDAMQHALEWLRLNNRQRATADTARSCIKTAILLASKLPPKPDHIVIPTESAWFTLDDQFDWWANMPSRRMGVCHQVKLNDQPFPGLYWPKEVPEDSLFGRYLTTSLPDLAVRELVQEYIGYSLSNANYQTAQFWVGAGSNGKSVLLNIVRALHEKAVAMRLDKLDGFDLTALVGASLAICDETPKGKVNQQALKSLISMGAIEINPKYRDSFTYTPMAKWIICGNHLPSIGDHSEGWWRRFQIIEWNVQVKGEDIIHDLDNKIIKNELHIVLDWALAGLQRLAKRGGFAVPERVQLAKQEAVQDSNTVASWMDMAGVQLDSSVATNKMDLYASYQEYCHDSGFPACNMSQFYKRVNAQLPGVTDTRVTLGTGSKKHRVRCVNVAMGRFDDEQAEANEQDVMADCPF